MSHVTPIIFDPAVSEETAQRAISADLRRLRTDRSGTARAKYWSIVLRNPGADKAMACETARRRVWPELAPWQEVPSS